MPSQIVKTGAGGRSTSHVIGTTISTYSEADISAELTNRDASGAMSSGADLSFQLSGNNDIIPGSPDIDTKGDFAIGRIDSEEGSVITISGSIFGDKFPANETFLTDQNGTGVFLGVSEADGNPFTSLPGDNCRLMSRFNIGINFGSNGNVIGVTAGNSTYSVEAWNARFSDLNPKDANVGTTY
jgi:hypothetical protein